VAEQVRVEVVTTRTIIVGGKYIFHMPPKMKAVVLKGKVNQ
jgi:hypothetical protein